jgi:TetR/AcrR family transcriptional regulator
MDNKTLLREIALSLFYQKNYDGVGVQEIVSLAGVTKPTLYHYFTNKRGLYQAIFAEGTREDFQKLKQQSAYHGDFTLSLEKLVFTLKDCFRAQPKLYSILFRFSLAGTEGEDYQVARPYLEQIYTVFLTLFINARAELGNMHGREEQFAHSLLAMVVDFLFRTQACHDECGLRGVIRQFQYGIYS